MDGCQATAVASAAAAAADLTAGAESVATREDGYKSRHWPPAAGARGCQVIGIRRADLTTVRPGTQTNTHTHARMKGAHGAMAAAAALIPPLAAALSTPAAAQTLQGNTAHATTCRVLPGDAAYPDATAWAGLNATLGGRLIATVPVGAACHDSPFGSFDAADCAALQRAWTDPSTHYDDPSSIMQDVFANQSCSPFLPRPAQCVRGTYVQYTVNATEPAHVATAIRFASAHNVRLVVKSTGHDYQGRSTGAGALGIWVHHMRNITFHDYAAPHYAGKAVTLGPGVQALDALRAAESHALALVGGECQSVALAGGYAQGGGHSSYASFRGLAADQVLEWLVVDGTGALLTASPTVNPDLYWAMSGGGGGTYAVAIAMTARAYPKTIVSGALLGFTSAASSQNFDRAVAKWMEMLPALLETGVAALYFLNATTFAISPLTAPNMTKSQLTTHLQPLISNLTAMNLPFQLQINQYEGFYAQYTAQQQELPAGTVSLGSRLVPRNTVADRLPALLAAYRQITSAGGAITGVCINVTAPALALNNSVNPAWRAALVEQTVTLPYNFSASLGADHAAQDRITHAFLPALDAVTAPARDAYASEADYQQPDFQRVLYGANYAGLRRVKARHDPHDVFYGLQNVGSDEWRETPDKRLCRVS